jgi:iron(III) transport system ATP-binding protein
MKDIRLESIDKLFQTPAGAVRAVAGVDLEIQAGELFFLLGPSGCGKTTLLRTIAGLLEPTAGRIFFGDRDVTDLPVEKRNTAMVFQNYALWPHMTVAKNVRFGPKMRGADRGTQIRRMQQSLERVEMLDFQKRKPNQLSGGQQQRVALARALAAEPDCLLLDEPLSNLDARLRIHMRSQLRQLVKDTGTTGIYVTHDQKEALSMADRVAVMHEGRIVQVDAPRRLYDRPATRFVADFVGEANFLEAQVDPTGPNWTLATAAGQIRIPSRDPRPEGKSATLCLRPEKIDLLAAAERPTGLCSLPAEVVSEMFLGEIRQVRCRLSGPDGPVWQVTSLTRRGASPGPGDPVRLIFAPQDVVLLGPEGGQGRSAT